MKFYLVLINQWLPSWPSPERFLFAFNCEMVAKCEGCGHSEAQLQAILFGIGVVFIWKWNGEKDEKLGDFSHDHA